MVTLQELMGVEVAGIFNLTIGKVKSFQAAGVFNAVGGDVEAAQFAGVLNFNKQNVKGFQAAGITNLVSGNLEAVQAAGIANIVNREVKGVQIAGIGNIAGRNAKALQIAGVGNIASRDFRGTQISGVFNFAKNFRGLQIGLINVADTSLGTSIGLINLSKNGYKKVSFFTNDLVNANAAIKTGNANLYTLLVAGRNYSDTARIETVGLGFGHDFVFGKHLAIETEVISQYLYLGNFDYANILTRFQANLELRIFKGFAIFGGPSYAYYNNDAPMGSSAKGYKQNIVPAKHHTFNNGNRGWWGWNVGVTLF